MLSNSKLTYHSTTKYLCSISIKFRLMNRCFFSIASFFPYSDCNHGSKPMWRSNRQKKRTNAYSTRYFIHLGTSYKQILHTFRYAIQLGNLYNQIIHTLKYSIQLGISFSQVLCTAKVLHTVRYHFIQIRYAIQLGTPYSLVLHTVR